MNTTPQQLVEVDRAVNRPRTPVKVETGAYRVALLARVRALREARATRRQIASALHVSPRRAGRLLAATRA